MLKRTRCLLQHLDKTTKYVPPSERAAAEHRAYSKNQRRSLNWGKFVQYGTLSLVGGSILMYFWQPWNPFSTDVSRELRKGLRQEQEGKEDYLQALKFYQNALKISKEEDSDSQLTLKYTGIVLKIAEMYEKLGMKDQLLKTYFNLATFVFENLIHESQRIQEDERDLLIDRDLIVITRWAMLKQEMKLPGWWSDVNSELLDRISFIENKEIKERLPWMIEGEKDVDVCELIKLWSLTRNRTLFPLEDKKDWIKNNIESQAGQEFLQDSIVKIIWSNNLWPAWVDSYLKLRDFYAMLHMSKGDAIGCIQYLQSNLLWSCVGDFQNAVDIPTQISNIGSAWFQYGQEADSKEAYNRATEIFRCLIEHVGEKHPILPISYYSLGIIYLEQNEKDKAIENFNLSKQHALEMGQIVVLDKIDDALIGQIV